MKGPASLLAAAIVFGLAFMLSCSAAAPEPGNDLPSYNVAKYCEHESDIFGSGNDSMLEFCLEQEQKSYDELKSKWAGVDKMAKYYCQPVGDLPSYYKLKVCLAKKSKEEGDLSQFKFRR